MKANKMQEAMQANKKTVYMFRQNNSGGYYCEPARHIIVVDAKDEGHALDIAAKAGLYLNGVSAGVDCSCCGDRWYDLANEFDSVQDAKDECGSYGDDDDEVPSYLVTDDLDWDWD